MAGNKSFLSLIGRFFSLDFSHYIFSFKCHFSANISLVGSNTCWPYQVRKTSPNICTQEVLTLVSRHCHSVWRIQIEIVPLDAFGPVWESYLYIYISMLWCKISWRKSKMLLWSLHKQQFPVNFLFQVSPPVNSIWHLEKNNIIFVKSFHGAY